MSYTAAVDQLYALGHELAAPAGGAVRRKFDLAHMRTLMGALGDPQRSFRSVLIAGTNGKGSTAATLASIVSAAGYLTGLYTSPHLMRVNERIQVSGAQAQAGSGMLRSIADEAFARCYFKVDEAARRLVRSGKLPQTPSFFEVMTALAFLYFAEKRVDLAVLEVGLGGRLDATNIVEPLLSVITDIGLDHQEYLGSTIAEIAREKAGILREGGTLVTLPQHPEANRVFGEVAAEMRELRAVSAAEYVPGPGEVLERHAPEGELLPRNRYRVTMDGRPLLVEMKLRGWHQQRNTALALAAVSELRNIFGYDFPDEAIERGIRDTVWHGRLEVVTLSRGQTLLLDVAHNPAGAWTLRSALAGLDGGRPRTLVFSCLRDKDLREMTQMLFPLFDSASGDAGRRRDHVVLTPVDNPRTAAVGDLLAEAQRMGVPAHAAPHVRAAWAEARSVTPEGGLLVVTGSVYLVGEVLRLVEELA